MTWDWSLVKVRQQHAIRNRKKAICGKCTGQIKMVWRWQQCKQQTEHDDASRRRQLRLLNGILRNGLLFIINDPHAGSMCRLETKVTTFSRMTKRTACLWIARDHPQDPVCRMCFWPSVPCDTKFWWLFVINGRLFNAHVGNTQDFCN